MPRAEDRDQTFFFRISVSRIKLWEKSNVGVQRRACSTKEPSSAAATGMGEAACLEFPPSNASHADKCPFVSNKGVHRFRSHYRALSLG